jgi:uncharacterized membrane protein
VEWNPPEDLSPAEVGTLIDESCDMADVVATLVDLAARGHLTIKAMKTDKLLFMSRRDYCFMRNPPPPNDTLAPHEALFLKGIFQLSGKNTVLLSELKGTFYSYLPGIKSAIYNSLMEKRYFRHRPDRVRALYTFWGVALMIIGGVATFVGYAQGHVALGIGVLAAGAIVAVFAKAMPAKTMSGTKAARECQGFRRFLAMVEKERIARMAQEDPTIFGRLLPYAMVLGVADQWAHAFEGLMTQPPNWYTSSDGATFNTIWFVHDLGSGMHSMGQTFVSRPQNQSSGWSGGGGGGFSGFSGGFSGGGFGGGGGGSW